jgi:cell division protein FtsB
VGFADHLAEAAHRFRRLVRGHWLVLPLALLLAWFVYHAIHGRRGLVAWMDLRREVAAARAELEGLEAKRTALEARVRALEPSGVDADLLEGELRRLGYVEPDELVILVDPPEEEAGNPAR